MWHWWPVPWCHNSQWWCTTRPCTTWQRQWLARAMTRHAWPVSQRHVIDIVVTTTQWWRRQQQQRGHCHHAATTKAMATVTTTWPVPCMSCRCRCHCHHHRATATTMTTAWSPPCSNNDNDNMATTTQWWRWRQWQDVHGQCHDDNDNDVATATTQRWQWPQQWHMMHDNDATPTHNTRQQHANRWHTWRRRCDTAGQCPYGVTTTTMHNTQHGDDDDDMPMDDACTTQWRRTIHQWTAHVMTPSWCQWPVPWHHDIVDTWHTSTIKGIPAHPLMVPMTKGTHGYAGMGAGQPSDTQGLTHADHYVHLTEWLYSNEVDVERQRPLAMSD